MNNSTMLGLGAALSIEDKPDMEKLFAPLFKSKNKFRRDHKLREIAAKKRVEKRRARKKFAKKWSK